MQTFHVSNLSSNREEFDLVIADVPCSGTGVWKRNPANKWLLTQKKLDNLISNQRNILRDTAKFVCQGGTLAFITCSVLKVENQQQTNWFLSIDKTFSLIDEKVFLPISGGDGFYVSLFRKI